MKLVDFLKDNPEAQKEIDNLSGVASKTAVDAVMVEHEEEILNLKKGFDDYLKNDDEMKNLISAASKVQINEAVTKLEEDKQKAIDKASEDGYKKGFKAGKKFDKNRGEADKNPKEPDCFGSYPFKKADAGAECRACPFAVKCKRMSKK